MSDRSAEEHFDATVVVTRADRSVSLRVRRARLSVVEGPDAGLAAEIRHQGVVVGSSVECDFVLSDPAISRRHFEIVPDRDGYRLRDLGSKNGTGIGKIRISVALLTAGQEIRVGQSRLLFTILDGHDELPISRRESFGPLLGRSVAMRHVFAVLERAAATDTTLLLEGESGVGKDLAAEAVHSASARAQGPFVVVDCGAMPAGLAESELFGHRKGAFTGADRERAGALEAAHRGTLFLDEVGELGPSLQPKLLGALERKEIKRLGDNNYRSVDVRLIAATNRDLEAEVVAGRFREDLFYRLSVVRVRMPPLRDRGDDVELLASHFLRRLKPELDPTEVLTDQVRALLLGHSWPGNVRELRNVIERLLLFPDAVSHTISAQAAPSGDIPAELLDLTFKEAKAVWIERFERAYLLGLLNANAGVVTRAAKHAGLPRQSFHRLLAKYNLGR